MVMTTLLIWVTTCHPTTHPHSHHTGEVVTITTEEDHHLATDAGDQVPIMVPCTGWDTMTLVAVEALVPVVPWCLHTCLHP